MQVVPYKGFGPETGITIGTNPPAGRCQIADAGWKESMPNAIRGFVQDNGWTSLAIGPRNNTLGFSGRGVFLPTFEQLRPAPTWVLLHVCTLMLIGVLAPLRVSPCED